MLLITNLRINKLYIPTKTTIMKRSFFNLPNPFFNFGIWIRNKFNSLMVQDTSKEIIKLREQNRNLQNTLNESKLQYQVQSRLLEETTNKVLGIAQLEEENKRLGDELATSKREFAQLQTTYDETNKKLMHEVTKPTDRNSDSTELIKSKSVNNNALSTADKRLVVDSKQKGKEELEQGLEEEKAKVHKLNIQVVQQQIVIETLEKQLLETKYNLEINAQQTQNYEEAYHNAAEKLKLQMKEKEKEILNSVKENPEVGKLVQRIRSLENEYKSLEEKIVRLHETEVSLKAQLETEKITNSQNDLLMENKMLKENAKIHKNEKEAMLKTQVELIIKHEAKIKELDLQRQTEIQKLKETHEQDIVREGLKTEALGHTISYLTDNIERMQKTKLNSLTHEDALHYEIYSKLVNDFIICLKNTQESLNKINDKFILDTTALQNSVEKYNQAYIKLTNTENARASYLIHAVNNTVLLDQTRVQQDKSDIDDAISIMLESSREINNHAQTALDNFFRREDDIFKNVGEKNALALNRLTKLDDYLHKAKAVIDDELEDICLLIHNTENDLDLTQHNKWKVQEDVLAAIRKSITLTLGTISKPTLIGETASDFNYSDSNNNSFMSGSGNSNPNSPSSLFNYDFSPTLAFTSPVISRVPTPELTFSALNTSNLSTSSSSDSLNNTQTFARQTILQALPAQPNPLITGISRTVRLANNNRSFTNTTISTPNSMPQPGSHLVTEAIQATGLNVNTTSTETSSNTNNSNISSEVD